MEMKRTVAIVGAGRVGRELGRRLRLLGWRIGAVVTRAPASARAAVRWIGAGTPHGSMPSQGMDADLILIAVPDREIESIAKNLAELSRTSAAGRPGVTPRKQVALHTSGSLSHEALRPLMRAGIAIGAMHPMQTFGQRARPDFRGTVFGIDGNAAAVRLARRIARELGGTPVEIDARKKAAYHCAGGFAAQHVLAVIEAGVRLLRDAGLARADAVRSLCRMAHQTLDNLQRHGPAAAWSGPVARRDFATVAKHREVLKTYPRDFGLAYEALTRLVVTLVAANPAKVLRALSRATNGRRKAPKGG